MMKILKKYLYEVKNSNDKKTLIANFGYLSLLQIAGYVFPIITLPYLARVIGLENFGKIALASAVIGWIQTITDWGFNYTATRDVAKNRNDIEKISEIFSKVLWAKCLLMGLSFVLLFCFIMLIPKFREYQILFLITFLLVPGRILFPDWFFQAIEKMKYITILNIISKLIFTVAVFLFIKERSDYLLQPLLISLGFIVSGIISMFIILVKWRVKISLPTLSSVLSTIKDNTDVFINTFMPNLYNSLSIVILSFFGGETATGKLDAGSKFVRITQELMSVLSRTFYPFLSRRIDKHNIYTKINIYISLFLSITLFFLAPIIVKIFFTPEFYDSIIVLQILSISIVFLSLSNVYGTNYMIIKGHEKQLRNITFICSVIGFGLSIPLIYYFNYIGAALTISLTRGLLGVSIMLKAKRIKRDS